MVSKSTEGGSSATRRAVLAGAALAPLGFGGALAAEPALGAWRRIETPAFILHGRDREPEMLEFARDLTDFDALLRSLHSLQPNRPVGRALPVYLVDHQRDLQRMWPTIDSRVGGFYNASVGETFAALATGLGDDGGRGILFHEYTHHFMFQHAPAAYPAWLIEGYASYFETTRFTAGNIEIGVTNRRIAYLRGSAWTPFEDILASRPLEGGRADTAAFYAQSWILTHYMLADPQRQAALAAYAQGVATGGDPVALMAVAVGAPLDTLIRTLKSYMERLPGRRLPRPAPAPAAALTVTRLPASADALLLENQRLKRGVPEGERPALLALIRERAAQFPGDRLAELTLARAENDYGDRLAAQALLMRRIEADPRDVEVLQMLGWSWMLRARAEPAQRAAHMSQARIWLGKGFAIDPDNALLLYDYALTRRGEPTYPSDNIVNVLLKAYGLAPQITAFRVAAADALMRRDRFDEALALLTPILNNPHARNDRARIQGMIDQVRRRSRPGETPAEPTPP
jgi:hypothetical protein